MDASRLVSAGVNAEGSDTIAIVEEGTNFRGSQDRGRDPAIPKRRAQTIAHPCPPGGQHCTQSEKRLDATLGRRVETAEK